MRKPMVRVFKWPVRGELQFLDISGFKAYALSYNNYNILHLLLKKIQAKVVMMSKFEKEKLFFKSPLWSRWYLAGEQIACEPGLTCALYL